MDNKCVEKLLETVAFSNGCICSVELIRWEHTHFHPSGDATPSEMDVITYKKMKQASEIMGVSLKDNLIVGNNGWYSFTERGF